ncbi:MAG: hypothetical protein KJO07_25905, partial [Deltaproteobacteria bacterium]|nr:hypothetical protein [Deltaproteobacteria bacterium]
MSKFAIGIDLGGTNFRLALYRDLDQATPDQRPAAIAVSKESVGDDRAPVAVVQRLSAAVEQLSREHGAED